VQATGQQGKWRHSLRWREPGSQGLCTFPWTGRKRRKVVTAGGASAILQVTNAQVFYDRSVEALKDVSLGVARGQIVCLLGANGSGKSTLLKAISAILGPEKGVVTKGSIQFEGKSTANMDSDAIVRAGIVQVPEGRRLFGTMTVEENLLAGGFTAPGNVRQQRLAEIFEIFPDLTDHRKRVSGYLSGGQQQMVAIGRALMSSPTVLMLDEPSLGLAPKIVEQIFTTISTLRATKNIGVLLVEQNARLALGISDYGYVIERGRVVFDGTSEALLRSPEIQEFYLGMGNAEGRKSLRDVKHYRRRKRWLS
jgi:branched-chain amino acid transport system ATP-binding protein